MLKVSLPLDKRITSTNTDFISRYIDLFKKRVFLQSCQEKEKERERKGDRERERERERENDRREKICGLVSEKKSTTMNKQTTRKYAAR